MYTPDYARDIEPSVYGEPIRPRRWSLARWNYRLGTAGTAKAMRAIRVRRLLAYLVAAVVLGPAK